jgi:8-oxo-dGTP pyrophosphatase MutT (NUDIX family)
MPTPDFILELRKKIGHDDLWLSGVTAVVLRARPTGPSGADDADGTAAEAAEPREIQESSEVLLVRRADNGHWTPVTGVIDPGEEPAAAAEREVLEEADIVAEAEHLAWVHVGEPVLYENGDRSQYIDIVFRCRWISGEPFPADGENTEAAWYPLDALPAGMSADMRERISEAVASRPHARFER